ncbi:DUF4412 domain-containing protein [Sediminitomix flava]|uniref:Uncharacterized protein DUF4412 n=1 Tax=Sediminitomix flava TaxID=379075 RepID=A0A315ZBP9_SEDFL|nr:DUF4412 domain-containing protein [Sediminitomix flava]PWJ42732.1 uncharacterized protein DUF4412 [Sediminitomix flava]
MRKLIICSLLVGCMAFGFTSYAQDPQGDAYGYRAGLRDASSEVRDNYNFDLMLLYEFVSQTQGRKESTELKYWVNKKHPYFAAEIPERTEDTNTEVVTVFDHDKEQMVSFSEDRGNKRAMVLPLDPSQKKKKDLFDEEAFNRRFKATGKTRKINNYKCEEYIAEDDEGKVSVWLTEVEFEIGILPGSMQKKEEIKKAFGKDKPVLFMEMSFEDKTSGEKGQIIIKDIEKSEKEISSTDYRVLGLDKEMYDEFKKMLPEQEQENQTEND